MDRPPPVMKEHPASPLDGTAARLGALCVLLLVFASLTWIHRDRLFPPDASAVAADDPVAACLAQRAVDIDRMREEGTITAEQAALFKSRAEALCQAQAGQQPAPGTVPRN